MKLLYSIGVSSVLSSILLYLFVFDEVQKIMYEDYTESFSISVLSFLLFVSISYKDSFAKMLSLVMYIVSTSILIYEVIVIEINYFMIGTEIVLLMLALIHGIFETDYIQGLQTTKEPLRAPVDNTNRKSRR